jgi:hypothetical protein
MQQPLEEQKYSNRLCYCNNTVTCDLRLKKLHSPWKSFRLPGGEYTGWLTININNLANIWPMSNLSWAYLHIENRGSCMANKTGDWGSWHCPCKMLLVILNPSIYSIVSKCKSSLTYVPSQSVSGFINVLYLNKYITLVYSFLFDEDNLRSG